MSAELVAQWSKRVRDAEEEVGRMQEDINSVKQQRKSLKSDIRKYEDVVAAEKRQLLSSLERVEEQAKALGAQCESALAEKDRVEAEYITALDEYEKLHFFVRDIQDAEEHLQSREDLEAKLQRESLEWAEEEHALRRRLHQLQQQQSQARRAQQTELQELETALANMEKRQREERAARSGEVVQAARSAVRANPSHPSAAPTSPVPSAEENAFMQANAGGGVPTRSAALRSCLKTPAPAASAAAVSAPVSRCASQSLLTETGKASGASAARSKESLQVLQQMRAFSYGGPEKAGSRKREFLGESTNEQ